MAASYPTEDSAAGVWGQNQSGLNANPSPRDVTLTLGLRVTVRATGAEGSHHATLPTHKTQCKTEATGRPDPAGNRAKELRKHRN